MRVGMFTYGIDDKPTGIARYAVELTRALHRLEPALEIVLLNPYPDSQNPWYREFETYPLPHLKRLPAAASLGNWELHRAAKRLKLDILHDPCGIAPFLAPGGAYRRVTTIHDAVPYIYPETQPLLTRLVFGTLVRAARFTADAVFTVSTSAAHDLAHHVGIPRHKLCVTPNGISSRWAEASVATPAALEALGVRSPYFLYVGALHPRKNLSRVLQAFRALDKQAQKLQLVIVGPSSWGAQGVLGELSEQAQRDASVLLTGFVSDDTLQALYRGARALVFPSLYEGFGLPALEAMAHGTPVITSNCSSLPEVVGEAGVLVDPLSVEAIARAMDTLLHDETLHHTLSVRSRDQASMFSWESTATKTLAVYKQLVSSNPNPLPSLHVT